MTTPFLETPRLPDEIAFWAQGGPNYNTSVVTVNSGFEQRVQTWQYGLGTWNIIEALRLPDGESSNFNLGKLRDLFRVVKGQTYGFRMKDFTDFEDEGNGVLNPSGVGNGFPLVQMYKNYIVGAMNDQRMIKKPSGTINVFRNGVLCTYGTAPGNISLDTTTGIVAFKADSSASVTAITKANPGVVTATAHGYTTGDIILLSSIGGMTQVNNGLFTITVIDANNFSIGVNTTSYTTYTSGGTAAKYPQPADTLTWTGEFDTPVRFGTDIPLIGMGDGGMYSWTTIPILEIRL